MPTNICFYEVLIKSANTNGNLVLDRKYFFDPQDASDYAINCPDQSQDLLICDSCIYEHSYGNDGYHCQNLSP